ncbi:hypothetical protein ACO0J1_14330 [Stenotrophomonas acidaminiphila]|uniref:hypothetical protein n=1 Tax=Stenotrophomonas acidaminiphila TaxID=128780 RepID=UPI0039BC652E
MTHWSCSHCRESNEDTFDQCWKCGTRVDGSTDPGFRPDNADPAAWPPRLIDCLRCPGTPMVFAGRKRFHEGSQALPFLLGNLGELLVNREAFDLHACPSCGKVELFLGSAPR